MRTRHTNRTQHGRVIFLLEKNINAIIITFTSITFLLFICNLVDYTSDCLKNTQPIYLQKKRRNICEMEEITAARYTQYASSDMKSITTLKSILDLDKVVAHLSENDKIPNYDGYLEILNSNGIPIGKIETQVKTHRENYSKPSFSVKLNLLAYARDVVQLPFILIAVDQKNKKAFWKEITHENARLFINEALARKPKSNSYSIQFDKENEIAENPPYDKWKEIIESHKKLFRETTEINKQLIISEVELKKLKLKLDFIERDVSQNYVQIHIFLDTLNNLFSKEFKIIKKLFVSDFWKFGIVTFGDVTENRITYSLFSIDWNENLRQINTYEGSNDIQNFINDYPSVRAHSGKNPILKTPVKYAYEKLWEYLKFMLDKKLIWPNDQYLQQEFLFHINDTKFGNLKIEEPNTLNLVFIKEQIDNYLNLIPESEKKLMKDFPEINGNLYRALDYIQNFRILKKKLINRLSPSKISLQNITTSVGEKGKLPEDIKTTLFDYWHALLNSYENVLDEFFPLVKEELSNNNYTYIIIPVINDSTFNIPYLRVLKFNTKKKLKRNIFIEMNQSNIKLDFKNGVIIYNEKKYKFLNCENEIMSISSLIDDMPIRKGVYHLLNKHLKNYFERLKEL